jgi:hypothetical protein
MKKLTFLILSILMILILAKSWSEERKKLLANEIVKSLIESGIFDPDFPGQIEGLIEAFYIVIDEDEKAYNKLITEYWYPLAKTNYNAAVYWESRYKKDTWIWIGGGLLAGIIITGTVWIIVELN